MLQPPQNLKATYASGNITVSWNVANNSDSPNSVTVTLYNSANVASASTHLGPGLIPSTCTFGGTDVSKLAGTNVAVIVVFSNQPVDPSSTQAVTHVLVPGTPPPPPPAVGAPSNLSVTYNPSTHSVEFHWVNHGSNSGNYDKTIVQWGVVTNPNPAQFDMPGNATQAGPLGPIYPNTNYIFKVEGGTSQFWNYTYTGWSTITWVSPAGTPPLTGWLNAWFQIHPEAPLQPPSRAALAPAPHRYVTALWGTGSRNNHLDLFLAGGIPTLGVVWSDWWEAGPGWQSWFNVSDAVWAPSTFITLGSDVTAVWRPNDTHLDLFAIANNGTVWSTWWEPNPGWQAWFPIDDQIKMAPGASVTAVWRPNATHLDLFVCGTAGVAGMAWTTWWEPNKGWQPWTGVSNAVWAPNVFLKPGARITALWRDDNHLDVFGTANDGSIWSNWWEPNPGWQNWFAIPTPTVVAAPGSPVAALWSFTNLLELFATGGDGRVVTTHWTPSGWAGWTSLDPSTKFTPGAAITALANYELNQIEILGTDIKGNVSTTARTLQNPAAAWQPWFAIRPGPAVAPGATVAALWRPSNTTPTHLDLFVRGADGSVWSIWWENSYYG